MLNGPLLHPELLAVLATAGHGSQVLVGDGNYPFGTGANPDAPRVYLNLAPGLVGALEVVEVLAAAVPIEAAHAMAPAEGPEPEVFADFRRLLPAGVTIETMGRSEFYAAANAPTVALVVATAERRLFSNLMLTIGVRTG
jgi:L-fucose mutarotase